MRILAILTAAALATLATTLPAAAEEQAGIGIPLERPSHTLAYSMAPDDGSSALVSPVAAGEDEASIPEGLDAGRPWVFAATRASSLAVAPEVELVRLEAIAARAAELEQPLVVRVLAEHPRSAKVAECLPTDPADPDRDEASLAAWRRPWLESLRTLGRRLGGGVRYYLLDGLLPDACGAEDGPLAAYEIKSASVTLRGEDARAGLAVAVHGWAGVELLQRAYREVGDLEPYLDGLLVAGGEGTSAGAARRALLTDDPGLTVWAEPGEPISSAPEASTDTGLARALDELARGADLALVSLPAEGGEGGAARRAFARLAAALDAAWGRAPVDGAGVARSGGAGWLRLYDDERMREVILYWNDAPAAAEEIWRFDPNLRRGYRVVDPIAREERFLRPVPGAEGDVTVEVPSSARPRLILVGRQRVSPGVELDDEELESRSTRGVTVEEVLAAAQRSRSFQGDRLRTVRRAGRISFRPRLSTVTGTFDLTLEGDYFWDPESGGEWVIENKYVNGVRLTWDEIWEFPFFRWEQVVQAPLELELDDRYVYELDGDDEVSDRDCWVVRFEPARSIEGESLYQGRAWIDKSTGALVRIRSVQTGLTEGVISREETRTFAPYEGPDGNLYWLLEELDGQILYSISGNNLVVLQKWTFGPPTINDARFAAARAEGYASESQMLRDTGEGFKWLERTEEGGRAVREEADTAQWLAAVGVVKDEGLDGTFPLAGVNYVDLDAFDRGVLFNVLFAGVFANVTLSDPEFLGSRIDTGLNFTGVAVPRIDRVFSEGEEVDALRVERMTQSLRLHAGIPTGAFSKLRLGVGFDFVSFDEEDETEVGFVIPEDHTELSASLRWAYDREGWGFSLFGERAKRSDWEPWGPSGGLVSGEELEASEAFEKYEVVATRTWFMRNFQQVECDVTLRDGNDLDRFSAFTFGLLSGDRFRGFGGSGIRYDEGVLVDVSYAFTISDVLRFEGTVDYGTVRGLEDGISTQHTGFGIAASFPGPWKTFIRLDAGVALDSDIEEIEGDTELLLLVLKLF